MMDTLTLLWLVIIATGLLFFVLSSIIWALYKQLTDANSQLQTLQQQQQDYHIQAENFKTQNTQLREHNLELKANNQELQTKFEHLQTRHSQLSNQYTQINTTLKQKEEHFVEQIKLFNENRQQLKLEFEQLASQIFDAKGKSFTEQSQQSLQSLLTPFREQIAGFRHKVEEIHHAETIQKTELTQELKHLKELNLQITQETHELTVALKGDKKMQGNWGELILENILEQAGLQPNKDFSLQKRIYSEEGEAQVPDVIINLPQQKHLVIDAKVSLNAYIKTINATSDELQQSALKEHIKAISQRIKELSERFYYKSADINSPELVIMFIPIEPAFITAFKSDETLLQKAIDQNILVATPTTLLACLTIVRQLWRLENQSRNTLELANTASRVYDKLRNFLTNMDKIEKSLINAQDSYQEAKKQLMDGRGNLVSLVNNFVELGVTVKNEISEEWQEKAALGIEVPEKPQ
ncbi:DNA recombination protein RmuC [Entomomonas asaccharolytica]|uniref:DNA recombination protein RmuC n=1 Tax=Entomomonas asaccharolytica TaxID=2785331 RepID=A0A974NH28_9GAMM|nr:DNA recombination protein RmuC [Entomomonas asaccharolytica]QQP86334.1 DNA recombination protein RmuC [Entomomonas asaccharolytica]